LREHETELTSLGARVIAISFESPDRAAVFAGWESLPFPLLLDPSRRAYAAFGLQEAAPSRLWNWNSLRAYVRGMIRGRGPRLPHADITQLGGDFVIDAANRIVFEHRSAEPADRPSVADILAAIRAALARYPAAQEPLRD
jgi:hypothetical protein